LKPSPWRWRMVAMISKWSMVDVFVVAILVAFMTAKATAELQAELLPGFWWFLSFCLLSVLSGQLLAWNQDRR
ncbi:MAG: paraquat-inducible protein A, partial [Oleibacter sp.]|nr:paraquat-inducible protein A [Thalassolituus sp.]